MPSRRCRISSKFQDGSRRHLGCLKFQILTVRTVKRVELRHHAKLRRNLSKTRPRYVFPIFQDGSGFSKFEKKLTVGTDGRTASLCQFRQNRSNRGRNIAIFRFFKMATVAILQFRNLKLLTVGTVNKVELHQCAKSRQNRLNRG